MKPLILQGHSRPIKDLKFNIDGDLLFSASDDRYITLWATETGERIGTFHHSAAVNTMSLTNDSKILVSGDKTGGCYFWEINTGALLKKIDMDPTVSVRSTELSFGQENVAIAYSGRLREAKSQIDIYRVSDILSASTDSKSIIRELEPIKSFSPNVSKFAQSKWINLNNNLVVSHEDGTMCLIDYKTSDIVKQTKFHTDLIMDFDISRKEEIILTASKDGKSCVIDPDSFDLIHTLHPKDPTRGLNSCKISPLFTHTDEEEAKYHALIAGGQESRNVTTTHAREGGFDVLFYNIMYGEELGAVQGHFGPVNTLAFGPNGRIFASGAEDATIRVHKLEEEYNNLDG
jgi:translation initiation factor 3 subunit I